MRTKQEIMADATIRFTELNVRLLAANLPAFPIETAYVDLDDDLNGEDAVVTKWFNETMRRNEEMVAAIQGGDGFHDRLNEAKLRLQFIETVCEIHTKLVKLLINAELAAHTVH